jgi:hypothetical protein
MGLADQQGQRQGWLVGVAGGGGREDADVPAAGPGGGGPGPAVAGGAAEVGGDVAGGGVAGGGELGGVQVGADAGLHHPGHVLDREGGELEVPHRGRVEVVHRGAVLGVVEHVVGDRAVRVIAGHGALVGRVGGAVGGAIGPTDQPPDADRGGDHHRHHGDGRDAPPHRPEVDQCHASLGRL